MNDCFSETTATYNYDATLPQARNMIQENVVPFSSTLPRKPLKTQTPTLSHVLRIRNYAHGDRKHIFHYMIIARCVPADHGAVKKII